MNRRPPQPFLGGSLNPSNLIQPARHSAPPDPSHFRDVDDHGPRQEPDFRSIRPLSNAAPGNRGNSRLMALTMPPGPSSLNIILETTETIVESPRNGGEDAEMITCTLGISDLPDLGEYYATAIVEWGIGGASFSARMDWRKGSVFSVPASSLAVRCRIEHRFISNDDGFTKKVLVSAALAYGTTPVAHANPCRYTLLVGSLLSGEQSAWLPIPAFATSFCYVSRAENIAPNQSVIFLRANNAPDNDGDMARYSVPSGGNGVHDGFFTIPEGAREISVLNGVTASARNAIVFAIGI